VSDKIISIRRKGDPARLQTVVTDRRGPSPCSARWHAKGVPGFRQHLVENTQKSFVVAAQNFRANEKWGYLAKN